VGAQRLGGEAPIDRIRAFFGLPLPEENRRRLESYLRECSQAAPEFRWSDAGNLHLTLRFVGSVERDLVDGIAGRVDAGSAFDVALGGIGTFRRGRLTRVVWLGVGEGAEALRALAGRLEAECRAAGLEPETRAFTAHLTLARARARDGAALPDLPALPELEVWRANELVLYSSHLGRGGAVHEPIRSVRLAE
jgi:RNA 2',3'-cyclic 3'-phosphodiesterase